MEIPSRMLVDAEFYNWLPRDAAALAYPIWRLIRLSYYLILSNLHLIGQALTRSWFTTMQRHLSSQHLQTHHQNNLCPLHLHLSTNDVYFLRVPFPRYLKRTLDSHQPIPDSVSQYATSGRGDYHRTSPPATYSFKQVLDFPVQTPSLSLGVSIAILAAQANRPTHHSSAKSSDFESIIPRTLRPIPALPITEFRNYVTSLESIRFGHSMAIPWEASPMLLEGCVTGYLDTSVLGPVW